MRQKWSPYDLPYLREAQVTAWLKLAEFWGRPEARAREKVPGASALDFHAMADALREAPLTWIARDFCSMIRDTMGTVPQWSPEEIMPSQSGLVAFDTPLFSAVWNGDINNQRYLVPIDAIFWKRTGDMVKIRALSRLGEARGALSPLREGIPWDEVFATTTHVQTLLGKESDVELVVAEGFPSDATGSEQLLGALGAMWLLMAQPTVVEEANPVQMRVKRSGVRPGQSSKATVQVNVRSLVRKRRAGHGGGRRGKATTRWWVRGHWRQQAWGKDRKVRKPVFIEPHTAGARGAEVVEKPNVTVWKKET